MSPTVFDEPDKVVAYIEGLEGDQVYYYEVMRTVGPFMHGWWLVLDINCTSTPLIAMLDIRDPRTLVKAWPCVPMSLVAVARSLNALRLDRCTEGAREIIMQHQNQVALNSRENLRAI